MNRAGSRTGQAFLEYLLMVVIIAGVILGVMYPAFKKQIEALQVKVQSIAQKTVSQREMGIPKCWFFCGDGGGSGLDSFTSGLGAGSQQGGGGAGGLAGSAGAGSAASKLGTGRGALAKAGASSSKNGLKGGSGGSGSGGTGVNNEGNFDDNEGPPKDKPGKKDPLDKSASTEKEKEAAPKEKQQEDKKSDKKEDGPQGAIFSKKMANQEERRGASGGCQDIDFWTAIKMLIVIVIVILGAIIALSNRKKD